MAIEQQVAATIKGLPMRLRKVFVMAYVERKPREEIAAALHISEARLEERLTKAVEIGRERLRKAGVDLADRGR